MSRSNYWLSIGLAGTLFVAGPARGAAAQSAVTSSQEKVDEAVQALIEGNLKNNTILAPRDIDVEVEHGVVTLTGKVRTEDERSRAGAIANVKGVTRVLNNIEVDPKIDHSKVDAAAQKTKTGLTKAVDATVTATEKSKGAVQKGVGKTEQGVGKGADKTAEAVAKVGDKTTDASITTRVKAGFTGETLLKDSAIDVDTTNHVVTLKGTVASAAAKERAATVAIGIQGVIQVFNQLVVRVD